MSRLRALIISVYSEPLAFGQAGFAVLQLTVFTGKPIISLPGKDRPAFPALGRVEEIIRHRCPGPSL